MKRFALRRLAAIRIRGVVPFLSLFPFILLNVSALAPNGFAQTNSNSQKAAPAPGQISGHVYRADTGAPVAKVQMGLLPVTNSSLNVTGERRFTLTDSEGFYSFAQIAPGTYTVAAKRDGFILRYFENVASPVDAQILTINSGDTLSKIDFHLITAGVISGTVLDEDNQPVASVAVEAVRLRYLRGGRRIEAPRESARTDDLGNFRLFNLPTGDYFVRVESFHVNLQTEKEVIRVAYYPNTMSIENAQPLKVAAGEEISGIRFSVGIPSSYSISGNIVDVTGSAGQRKYEVSVRRLNTGESAGPSASSIGGAFTLRSMAPGDYLLMANSTLLGASAQLNGQPRDVAGTAIARVGDGDAHVNIQVSPQIDVSGKILTEGLSRESSSDLLIVLWPELPILGSGPDTFHGQVERNGSFKIEYVPIGSYYFSTFGGSGIYLKQVVCNGKDYTFLPLAIEAGAGVNDCVLTMGTDSGVVKGQVLNGDKPAPGLTVIAIPQQRSLRHLDRFTITGKTDVNGGYQLSGVIPGDYLLFALRPDEGESYFDIDFADRNQQFAERVSVKSNETKTVALKPTTPQ